MIEGFLDFLSSHPPGGWTGPVLCLVAFVETLFPPIPGDILFIVISGWALSGGMPLPVAAAYGVAGCFLASCILFYLGHRPGRRLVDRLLAERVEPERVERARELVAGHGPLILAGSRFVPGVRSLLVLVAGTSGMKFSMAVLPIAFSAVAWYSILSLVGSVFGGNLAGAQGFMSHFEIWIWIALGIGTGICVLLRLMARKRA